MTHLELQFLTYANIITEEFMREKLGFSSVSPKEQMLAALFGESFIDEFATKIGTIATFATFLRLHEAAEILDRWHMIARNLEIYYDEHLFAQVDNTEPQWAECREIENKYRAMFEVTDSEETNEAS